MKVYESGRQEIHEAFSDHIKGCRRYLSYGVAHLLDAPSAALIFMGLSMTWDGLEEASGSRESRK